MSTVNTRTQCFSCNKETRTLNCGGCSKDFCLNCLNKHMQTLSKELDELENDHDQFRQILNDQKDHPKNHLVVQQIDQWENDSVNKIKQTAEECRQTLTNYTEKFISQIENRLNDIARQLQRIRQENAFNEIDLIQFKDKFNKLKEELDNPSDISIEQQSSSFISKMFVNIPSNKDTKWKQSGNTIVGGNGLGNNLHQLSYPFSIVLDDDQTIFIADSANDRIVKWKCNATNGEIVAGGSDTENERNQLSCPTNMIIDQENDSFIIADYGNERVMQWSRQNNTNVQVIISDINCYSLTMDKNRFLYVSDCKKNEVKRWKKGGKEGIVVAGGNGQGEQLNQFNFPSFIFANDDDESLYVSDEKNHRVMKWVKDATEGIVVAGGNGQGNSLTQLSSPQGVAVDQSGNIYIADRDNHRVMRWCIGDKEGKIVVGGNGKGDQSNQFNCPIGLLLHQGSLYVVDHENNRIQKFKID